MLWTLNDSVENDVNLSEGIKSPRENKKSTKKVSIFQRTNDEKTEYIRSNYLDLENVDKHDRKKSNDKNELDVH